MKTEDIENEIKKGLDSVVGQKMSPGVTKDAVAKMIQGTLNSNVASCTDVKVDIMWDLMTFGEKLKWFIFNRFPFKKEGDSHREAIRRVQLFHYQLEHSEVYCEELGLTWDYTMEMPRYLESSPKSIVVSSANVKLAQPMNFISVNLEIGGDKK